MANRTRQGPLVEALNVKLGLVLKVIGAEAGMHLAVLLPNGFVMKKAEPAALQKLWLWPLSPSYLTGSSCQGFILGFGGTSAEEMPRAVENLRELLR